MRPPAAWLAALTLLACATPAPAPSCPEAPPCPSCTVAALPAPAASSAPASAVASAPAAPTPPPPRQRPSARLFDRDEPEPGFFPRGDAFALGVDGKALDELVAEAERTKSDSLIVLKDGQVIAERYFGTRRGPIETMSITKSFAALAVMLLVDQGKIASLDAPASKYIPEFRSGKRASITLRHLLTQTSGLAHDKDTRVFNAQKDRTAYALKADVVDEPGSVFAYNNQASQLFSVVIERAAGKPIDEYLAERLFRPLGIRGWEWARDEGKNAQTYYGLALDARSLARVGQLLLDQGASGGKQLVSKGSVENLSTPSEKNPYYGLLWWIRYERVVHELDPEALGKLDEAQRRPLAALAGKAFASPEALWLDAGARLPEGERQPVQALLEGGARLARSRPDRAVGFYADGSLGQKLSVFPAQGLVAVRQRRRRPAAEESEALSFPSMHRLTHALVP